MGVSVAADNTLLYVPAAEPTILTVFETERTVAVGAKAVRLYGMVRSVEGEMLWVECILLDEGEQFPMSGEMPVALEQLMAECGGLRWMLYSFALDHTRKPRGSRGG